MVIVKENEIKLALGVSKIEKEPILGNGTLPSLYGIPSYRGTIPTQNQPTPVVPHYTCVQVLGNTFEEPWGASHLAPQL